MYVYMQLEEVYKSSQAYYTCRECTMKEQKEGREGAQTHTQLIKSSNLPMLLSLFTFTHVLQLIIIQLFETNQ